MKTHIASGELDELVIVATAILLLVAGSDTTGITLAFACYQLAKNSKLQEKLRDEINAVNSSDDLTYDNLQQMSYLDQVISETLRFHNLAGTLQRVALQDYKVPGYDLIIEKGMKVCVNNLAIHMDSKHYENPDVFDPEHFNKDVNAKRNP